MFQGGFVSWFLFYAALPFLLYYVVFIFYPINDWKVKRIIPDGAIEAGDFVTIRLSIKRRFPLLVPYLFVRDALPKSINAKYLAHDYAQMLTNPEQMTQVKDIKEVRHPLFKRHLSIDYQIKYVPRGVHSFHAVTLTVSDAFGFISKSKVINLDESMVVAPKSGPVVVKERDQNEKEGDELITLKPSSQSQIVSGVREYVPGDRIASINWKQTAKRETLMTKEFEQEQSIDGIVALLPMTSSKTLELNIAFIKGMKERFYEKQVNASFYLMSYPLQTFQSIDGHQSGSFTEALIHLKSINTDQLQESFQKVQADWKDARFIIMLTDYLTKELLQFVERMLFKQIKMTVYWMKSTDHQTEGEKEIARKLQAFGVRILSINETMITKPNWEVSI